MTHAPMFGNVSKSELPGRGKWMARVTLANGELRTSFATTRTAAMKAMAFMLSMETL